MNKNKFKTGDFVIYVGPDAILYNCGGFIRYFESDEFAVVDFDIDGCDGLETTCHIDNLIT